MHPFFTEPWLWDEGIWSYLPCQQVFGIHVGVIREAGYAQINVVHFEIKAPSESKCSRYGQNIPDSQSFWCDWKWGSDGDVNPFMVV